MSVRFLNSAFDAELAPTPRFVLVALAEHADDEGRCYPSVARVAQRTGLSERSVQNSIKQLCAGGYLNINRNAGKHGTNVYQLRLTPAGAAPPQDVHPAADSPHPRRSCTPTPAGAAPEPSLNRQEPSESNSAREIFEALAEWASPDPVRSFIAYRQKQKGKALSLTAARRQAKQLEAIFQHGGDTDDALGMAEERGWQSVQADWYFKAKGKKHDNRSSKPCPSQRQENRPDPAIEQIARLAGIGRASGDGSP